MSAKMTRQNHRSREELDRRRIDRALAGLEDAVRRCRDEDVRYGTGVSAALSFLERCADEKWPFEQFRKALEDPGTKHPEENQEVIHMAGALDLAVCGRGLYAGDFLLSSSHRLC
jgi:hypothetical protein